MGKREKSEARAKRRRARQMKKLFVWVLALGALAALVVFLVGSGGGDGDETSKSLIEPVSADEWIRGNSEAAVMLVEYSDFQCPACGSYYQMLKGLHEEFGEDVGFVYRHYPLSQTHPNAERAAHAAEAAGRQSKFWEMHDQIFEKQQLWSGLSSSDTDAVFSGLAQGLGLDVAQFQADMNSSEIVDKVRNDYRSGTIAGVNGTPTFFLNGEKIRNPRDIEEFRSVLLDAIGEVGA